MKRIEGVSAASLIGRMKWYRKKVDTQCVQIDYDFEIDVTSNEISGVVRGNAGDYICRNQGGGLYPVPKAAFMDMYEEVKPRGT